ncbi:magnesium transporter [Chelatococcus daeguensis]|uniref:Magnesium transporter MgtE n=2 Tax=Chelatococcus TaxID=28209 RepID=A0AAC9JPV2_9HYPH|nr:MULTISPECIES: magnesium transporter [Chelatococcus]APF36191.1 magnesium transporter [Chelatococcus daeguensis]KZE30514.1 magnesium transporter [Chelatococcus daeguensis]MBM3081857.1 magnesium transporter [Chelatococcus daeguensis]CUA89182.1 Mg2+ transporter (mgtE) [Chelatococcus sambhunathii]
MTAIITAADFRGHLAHDDRAAIKAALADRHVADIAAAAGELDPRDIAKILLLLPERQAAEVFGYFAPATQVAIADELSRSDLARLVTAMSHDERADLFNRLTPRQQQALLPGIAHAEREDIRRLAAYPEGTAGSLMTSDYAVLAPDLTAREAIDRLRNEAPDKETIYEAYVVDGARRLVGVLSLRDLLLARDEVRVADIMRKGVIFAHVQDKRDEVARKIADYDLLALPIVNGGDALVGIVTVDDAMDVAEAQRGRRVAQFGGNAAVGGGPDLDLLASSFMQMFRVRAFWLVLLTIFGVITSTFVAAQEEMLDRVIILAAFIAPIVDMGGNTGSQSATLVIRAMAIGDVKLRWRDVWFVIRREIPVALALGVVIAALEAVLAFFSKGVGGDVLLVVGLSMAICTVLGGLIGALLPFAARRIGTDPATLSSPLITSVMDLLGVLIYFSLAYAFLGHLLNAG